MINPEINPDSDDPDIIIIHSLNGMIGRINMANLQIISSSQTSESGSGICLDHPLDYAVYAVIHSIGETVDKVAAMFSCDTLFRRFVVYLHMKSSMRVCHSFCIMSVL